MEMGTVSERLWGLGEGAFKEHFSKDQQAPPLVAITAEAASRETAQPFEVHTNPDRSIEGDLFYLLFVGKF